MSAKEMFEEIDYEVDFNKERIRCFNKKLKYYVVFFLDYKIYTIGCKNKNEDVAIDIKLQQAINKQVEELGWYK